MRKISWSGKKVYVGIDVHKKSYAVSIACEGAIVGHCSMPADPKALISFLNDQFKGASVKCVYESGFQGFCLHRQLKSDGIDCIVVNPASIPHNSKDRVKTDKKDSAKLALLLEKDLLTPIYVPTPEEEARRLLTHTRSQLTAARVKVSNQIKMKCFQFGLIKATDKQKMSGKWLKKILAQNMSAELHFVLEILFSQWKDLSRQIREINKKLSETLKAKPKEEAILRSVPGVGIVSASTLYFELGDMSRFSNEKKLFSYLGLTPSEYSSGEKQYRGRISRQGPPRLRHILTEVAWRAIRKDPKLKKMYDNIKMRSSGKRAIVAVARKLAGLIRSCFQKGCHYELNYKQAA